MTRRERGAPLPDVVQGRWVSLDEPTAELIVSGGDVTCFGAKIEYGFREEREEDGAITVSLRPAVNLSEDAFQRANITELVVTPEGELHAYNVKFSSRFVRPKE